MNELSTDRPSERMAALTLKLPTIEQSCAVRDALDAYTRLAIGQIDVLTELLRQGTIPVGGKRSEREMASREQIRQVEGLVSQIKDVLGYQRNGSNGIGNPHIHASGHRAYEVMKALAREIAIQRDPNPQFRGVDYDGLTVRYTQDPAPTVTAGQGSQGDLDALRAFAQDVMEAWPMGDVDGGDLQSIATKHGLLKPEVRREPCGEVCDCADYAAVREFADGVTCYRKTPLLLGGGV